MLLEEFNKIYYNINGENIDEDIKSYLENIFAEEIPYIEFINYFKLDINQEVDIISFILNVNNFAKMQEFGYIYHKKVE